LCTICWSPHETSLLSRRMQACRDWPVMSNSAAITRLRKLILYWRSGASEGAAVGSVLAFQGRRATVGSSLEAGRPRLQQRLLGRHRGGVRLSGAGKRYPLGCRAGNGGKKQQPGSILAESSFPARARRARQIPSARALRRMRRNGSNAGLHAGLFGSNRVTCVSPCFHSSTEEIERIQTFSVCHHCSRVHLSKLNVAVALDRIRRYVEVAFTRHIPGASSANRKRALSSALFRRVEVPLALK
jgi:hypothetical protein